MTRSMLTAAPDAAFSLRIDALAFRFPAIPTRTAAVRTERLLSRTEARRTLAWHTRING